MATIIPHSTPAAKIALLQYPWSMPPWLPQAAFDQQPMFASADLWLQIVFDNLLPELREQQSTEQETKQKTHGKFTITHHNRRTCTSSDARCITVSFCKSSEEVAANVRLAVSSSANAREISALLLSNCCCSACSFFVKARSRPSTSFSRLDIEREVVSTSDCSRSTSWTRCS